MKRNKILLSAFLSLALVISCLAQFSISSGSTLKIENGTTLIVPDINNTSGIIENNGELKVQGNITNNGGGLFSSGSTGTISFEGSSAQEITGASTIHFYGNVDVNNINGVSLTNTETGSSHEIHGTLSFTQGKLILNSFNLTIGSNDPVGAGASAYIVTNSTGILKRSVPGDGSTNVLYPVGNSSYNPVTLQNSATATTDNYNIRVVDSKPGGFTGTTNIVDRSWIVSEDIADGSDLTIIKQWNSGEELSGFDRTQSMLGVSTDDGANVTWGTVGAASGSGPYTRSTSGITTLGTIMVGDEFHDGILLDLDIWLAGAYNTTNHNMDKTLNTVSLLPLTDPYSLSTTVSSVPSNAVDWVKIELRDKTDNTSVLYSFARFVDQDGQIIEEDESNFKMQGVTRDSYYIAVLHRNHLGVISNSIVDLDVSSPSFSFQSSQASAWQDGSITTNSALDEVETGVFGLWTGDANGDGNIKYNGTSNDKNSILNTVGLSTPSNIVASYSDSDINMDGDVKYNGTSNDKNTVLSVVGLSTPNTIISEHIPE